MPEHHGLANDVITNSAMCVVVHVGAADADRMEGYLDVVRTNFQREFNVPQGELVFFLQDERFHWKYFHICVFR